eukprot:5891989-Prymnesium_polylepis.1
MRQWAVIEQRGRDVEPELARSQVRRTDILDRRRRWHFALFLLHEALVLEAAEARLSHPHQHRSVASEGHHLRDRAARLGPRGATDAGPYKFDAAAARRPRERLGGTHGVDEDEAGRAPHA